MKVLRLAPYILVLMLAAGLGVGGYFAGVKVGRADEQARQHAADLAAAALDAERQAEWDDFNTQLAKEAAAAEDEHARHQRSIDAAIRLDSRDIACGGAQWLRQLGTLQ